MYVLEKTTYVVERAMCKRKVCGEEMYMLIQEGDSVTDVRTCSMIVTVQYRCDELVRGPCKWDDEQE